MEKISRFFFHSIVYKNVGSHYIIKTISDSENGYNFTSEKPWLHFFTIFFIMFFMAKKLAEKVSVWTLML